MSDQAPSRKTQYIILRKKSSETPPPEEEPKPDETSSTITPVFYPKPDIPCPWPPQPE